MTAARSRTTTGLALAVASAASFGLSGVLARGLLDTGWSAGATVALRIAIAAAVLVVPGILAVRGRWHLLRTNAGLITVYGIAAVAGAQLCYFYAVTYMQVSVALLLEYTAPVAVVVWLWLRHGHRPSGTTLLGAAIAAGGLVLVLDVVSGAELSAVGVLWALGAMVGAATYFVISADEDNGLPGITLAAGGLVVGGAVLLLAGLSGVLPFHASTADAVYDGRAVAWWIPVVALGLVTAAFSYVTGIAAGRRLGSRLASFVALGEVARRRHLGVAAARRAAPPRPAGRRPAGAGRRRRGQAGRVAGPAPGRAPAGAGARPRARPGARPQWASCRLRNTSRCSRSSAAATGTASRAPMMPMSEPPTRAATTVTEPGRSTDFLMIRG